MAEKPPPIAPALMIGREDSLIMITLTKQYFKIASAVLEDNLSVFMISHDDFTYALENTRIIVEPRSAIETFGQTSFRFHLVTEPMDQVGSVRVRRGELHAERPRILSPQHINKILLEGFGEQAREFAGLLEAFPQHFKVLRYGFLFKKTDVSEFLLRASKEDVLSRLEKEISESDDAMATLIEGVDDAWEMCLLKFTMDIIQRSAGENLGEWKKRGLIS